MEDHHIYSRKINVNHRATWAVFHRYVKNYPRFCIEDLSKHLQEPCGVFIMTLRRWFQCLFKFLWVVAAPEISPFSSVDISALASMEILKVARHFVRFLSIWNLQYCAQRRRFASKPHKKWNLTELIRWRCSSLYYNIYSDYVI